MAVAQVRDVAALAGVSPATVSNALNHPAKVAAATLLRIHAAIDELGFVRNDAARQLRAGQNHSVGMLVLDVRNPFFTDVARGVEDSLAGVNRPLILGNSAQDPEREQSYLNLFEEQRVAGILITPVGDVIDRLKRLRERGTCVVLVDRMTSTEGFSSVGTDDHLGGHLATDHLLKLGRRKISFLGGPQGIEQVQRRFVGAQGAVATFGEGDVQATWIGSQDAMGGRGGAEQLLALPRKQRPDAIFAANDLIALGVLQALTLAKVRVPEDIALIGYDDIEFAASAAIPLSSVHQPALELGRRAAELLLREIAGDNDAEPQHIVFEPTVVIRESTSL